MVEKVQDKRLHRRLLYILSSQNGIIIIINSGCICTIIPLLKRIAPAINLINDVWIITMYGSAQWCMDQPNDVWISPMTYGLDLWCKDQFNDIWISPLMCGSSQWCMDQPNDICISPAMYGSTQLYVDQHNVWICWMMYRSAQWCMNQPYVILVDWYVIGLIHTSY